MFTLHRAAVPLLNAFAITACLFYLMFQLVNMDEPQLTERFVLPPLEWPEIGEDSPPEVIAVKPAPPKPVELPPELILDDSPLDIKITHTDFGGGYTYTKPTNGLPKIENNQLVLAFGYPPVYPRNATTRGIEGYVVVGFSVSASGAVYDAHVLESEPKNVFDKSALNAIKKFKYKARAVQGKAVSTDGQRYLFRYELDE